MDVLSFCVGECCAETHAVMPSSGCCVGSLVESTTMVTGGTRDNSGYVIVLKDMFVFERRESLFLRFSLLIFMF
jgi:hypothetical protein